jgi:hypothetical protein
MVSIERQINLAGYTNYAYPFFSENNFNCEQLNT